MSVQWTLSCRIWWFQIVDLTILSRVQSKKSEKENSNENKLQMSAKFLTNILVYRTTTHHLIIYYNFLFFQIMEKRVSICLYDVNKSIKRFSSPLTYYRWCILKLFDCKQFSVSNRFSIELLFDRCTLALELAPRSTLAACRMFKC